MCFPPLFSPLLDNVLNETNGRFVCDVLSMPVGSSCHLTCDDGYLPKGAIHNTCDYDNVTESYVWSNPVYTDYECVPQVGVSKQKKYILSSCIVPLLGMVIVQKCILQVGVMRGEMPIQSIQHDQFSSYT